MVDLAYIRMVIGTEDVEGEERKELKLGRLELRNRSGRIQFCTWMGQVQRPRPTMRDVHCESICHAGRVAEEEEEQNRAKGIAHASADDFARKPGQFAGGYGES